MTTLLGQLAPNIALPSSTGETVSLSDFHGKNVVLYFYPKDMTPGCTTESCDFRDKHLDFSSLNTVIIGVSPDSLASHDKFINKHDLPFQLLADENKELSQAFGVWKLRKKFGKEFMGIERGTFVLDKEGKVAKEWRNVKVDGHVNEIYTFIKENLV